MQANAAQAVEFMLASEGVPTGIPDSQSAVAGASQSLPTIRSARSLPPGQTVSA
jgi:hypothetical protein